MKNSKNTLPFFTFSAGILLGMFLIGIYSFTIESPSPNPIPDNSEITLSDAKNMFNRYYDNATSQKERFKGFAVNKEEFRIMEKLFKNSDVSACRVYLGKDAGNNDVRIVVGTNSNNMDLIAGGIHQAPASHSSPCPTICDAASPITAK